MKTIYLTAPLELGPWFQHISTFFVRPLDEEYIDLSAEVALLSRNVKIQGDPTSELDQWGGHTQVAFGGIYRIENAEFYRMGQTGEMSRYPIHFHITQDYGQFCYAKYNSIHHSFQRAQISETLPPPPGNAAGSSFSEAVAEVQLGKAVAVHSTNYVLVKGNVAFDIIGHMLLSWHVVAMSC
ncbi:cemip2 [Symbiodinium sp. CCMP2456]|nr:cemip2 [Symbiodinium sp. CCMP2456]